MLFYILLRFYIYYVIYKLILLQKLIVGSLLLLYVNNSFFGDILPLHCYFHYLIHYFEFLLVRLLWTFISTVPIPYHNAWCLYIMILHNIMPITIL